VTIDEVVAGVPAWEGQAVVVEPIDGGLTNANYRLTVGGRRYCVRIPGRDSSLLAVDRKAEWRNTLAAAESGAGAGVFATVGEIPVMVLEWIDGEVQTGELLRQDAAVPRMADAIRRLHAGPAFVNEFNMFRIAEGYLRIVRERGFRIPSTYEDHLPTVARIEQAMLVRPRALVPCNNDLLAANYIDTPDGFRIIDYEYSGMNDPCFELGNTWAESELSRDQLAVLVERYHGEPRPDQVARALLWSVMSNYGWTLWAAIQHAVSDIDFDFWEWGIDGKYARAEAALASPELGGWIAAVAG
jgi:thiamine kinase-like enzyme